MGRKRRKVPQNDFGKRLLEIMPFNMTLCDLFDITEHIGKNGEITNDDGYKKRYLYEHVYGESVTLPAIEVQRICKAFNVSMDYLFGYDEEKEKSITDMTGLSEKAIERLEYLKQKAKTNQEHLNAMSMLLEEAPYFPFICSEFYSVCLDMASERNKRNSGVYIDIETDQENAYSAFRLNENLHTMRDKLIEKMRKDKSGYYTERVFLPVFSSERGKREYYRKKQG